MYSRDRVRAWEESTETVPEGHSGSTGRETDCRTAERPYETH